MPLVQCYEHPRLHKQYYPIDEKPEYVNDLKKEAYENIRDQYFCGRYKWVQKLFADDDCSVPAIIYTMNHFKKDVLKSFSSELELKEFAHAWRNKKLKQPFVISDNVCGMSRYSIGTVEVKLEIVEPGFLESLYNLAKGRYSLETCIFNLAYDTTLSCYGSTLTINTGAPSIVNWVDRHIDQVNVYIGIEHRASSIIDADDDDYYDYYDNEPPYISTLHSWDIENHFGKIEIEHHACTILGEKQHANS